MFWKNTPVPERAIPALSLDDLRRAITVLQSPVSSVVALAVAHESLVLFQSSIDAWRSGLFLVRTLDSRPEYMLHGLFGASMLAAKAQRGDQVEDRAELVAEILAVLRSMSSCLPPSLRWQYEAVSVQNDLSIAIAALTTPRFSILLDSIAFQMLEPLEGLLTLGQLAYNMIPGDGASSSQMLRTQCEARIVTLLRHALETACNAGMVSNELVSGVFNSVSVFAAQHDSTVTLVSLSTNEALLPIGRVAMGDISGLAQVQRTASLQLLKVALMNDSGLHLLSLHRSVVWPLVGFIVTVLDQIDQELRVLGQSFRDEIGAMALGTSAMELAAPLTERASQRLAAATTYAESKEECIQIAILLSRFTSFACHRHLRLTRSVAVVWPGLLGTSTQANKGHLTSAHAQKLLDAILERVRRGLESLNFLCDSIDVNHGKHADYHRALEYWVDYHAAQMICACSREIGVVQFLTSASKALGETDAALSDVAATVCAVLSKDALAAARAGDEVVSVILVHVITALQTKIMQATIPDSRRRAAVALSKYAEFCVLRGGGLLSAVVSTLLDAAAADSTDSLAAPRLEAASAALDSLVCVALAASDILCVLPNLKDRSHAAEIIHSGVFLQLQTKVASGLNSCPKSRGVRLGWAAVGTRNPTKLSLRLPHPLSRP